MFIAYIVNNPPKIVNKQTVCTLIVYRDWLLLIICSTLIVGTIVQFVKNYFLV